jgi:hypothetical protein
MAAMAKPIDLLRPKVFEVITLSWRISGRIPACRPRASGRCDVATGLILPVFSTTSSRSATDEAW